MRRNTWLLLVGLVTVAACLPGSIEGPGPPLVWPEAEVLRVADGDSIRVLAGDREVEVRLAGINAPEFGECYHGEAASRLAELVGPGPVLLDVTGEDQFGRTLAYVWKGSANLNLELVAGGHAIATTPLRPEFRTAESEARESQIGLWSPVECGRGGPLPAITIDFERSVFDPPGPDELALDEEVIFVRNDDQTTIALQGWVIRDESSRHRFRFDPGDVIRPGEVVPIRSSDPRWSPGGSPVWNNDGDIIMVLDSWGRVVAAHRY